MDFPPSDSVTAAPERIAPKQRYGLRANCGVRVVVQRRTGAYITAELLGLTVYGAALQVQEHLRDAEPISMRLEITNVAFAIDLPAEVRYVRADAHDTYRLECRFPESLADEVVDDLIACGVLERRELARQPISLVGTAWLELEASVLDVRLVDICPDGVGLVAPRPGAVGQRMRVQVHGGKRDLLVRVQWCRETADGHYFGCQFLQDGDYKRWLAIACELQRSQPQAPTEHEVEPVPPRSRNWLDRWRKRSVVGQPNVAQSDPPPSGMTSRPESSVFSADDAPEYLSSEPNGSGSDTVAEAVAVNLMPPVAAAEHPAHTIPTRETPPHESPQENVQEHSCLVQELATEQRDFVALRKAWNEHGSSTNERVQQLIARLLDLCRELHASSAAHAELTSEACTLREERDRLRNIAREHTERCTALELASQRNEQQQRQEIDRLNADARQLRQELAEATARTAEASARLTLRHEADALAREDLQNSLDRLRALLDSADLSGNLDSPAP